MKITEHDLRRSQFSYFLGKIVTLQTNAAAVPYPNDERGMFLHFRTYGGICEAFDEYGLWLVDAETNAKSFFFYKDIQGIIENPALPEDHPLVKDARDLVKKNEACKATVEKGKEVMGQMGEMSVTDFEKMFKTQIQEQHKR